MNYDAAGLQHRLKEDWDPQVIAILSRSRLVSTAQKERTN